MTYDIIFIQSYYSFYIYCSCRTFFDWLDMIMIYYLLSLLVNCRESSELKLEANDNVFLQAAPDKKKIDIIRRIICILHSQRIGSSKTNRNSHMYSIFKKMLPRMI
jgi:hypothetical protein